MIDFFISVFFTIAGALVGIIFGCFILIPTLEHIFRRNK